MAEVYLGLGSNLDREFHIRQSVAELESLFGEVTCSSIYETQAVGFDGPAFFNLVAKIKTDLTPLQLNAALKQIEQKLGRQKGDKKFASRTIDIDLLAYDDQIERSEGVQIPRDEILHHAFVLKPFCELAPEWIHPIKGVSLTNLWNSFPKDQQSIKVVKFLWQDVN